MFEGSEPEIDLPETTVEFDASALLPQNYVADNVERLNLYRKLSRSTNEQEIEEWSSEIEDRFGTVPKEAQNLIIASMIKLFASRNFFTKGAIRADRMWCICPKAGSELGNHYFDSGLFQTTLDALEQLRPDNFKVVQKNEVLRLVIQDIPDYEAALKFLKDLHQKTTKEPVTENNE